MHHRIPYTVMYLQYVTLTQIQQQYGSQLRTAKIIIDDL